MRLVNKGVIDHESLRLGAKALSEMQDCAQAREGLRDMRKPASQAATRIGVWRV